MRVKGPHAVSPRFPVQRSSEQGESAPKARQRCVADGKQVNIPAPTASAMWGRILIGYPGVGCPGLGRSRRALGKSGAHIPRLSIERACSRSNRMGSQEKPLSFSLQSTVPQTVTGARDEYSKALERTREKELGKLTPYLRETVYPKSVQLYKRS